MRRLWFLAIPLAAAALASAQNTPQPQSSTPSPALDVKNVQVLKGMSRDEIVWAMGFISQSLGVTCEYCHVRNETGFHVELDDKPEKRTARKMLLMMQSINDQTFDGEQRVTCATCHNGSTKPRAVNPIVDLETLKERQAVARQPKPINTNYPSAKELLAKYEQAIGGEAMLAKLTTRFEKFTAVNPQGTVTGEALHKAPDKFRESAVGGSTWVFDGNSARITSPLGNRQVTGLDLADVKFTADFWRTLKLTERYATAMTTGKEAINGRDTFVVEGTVKNSRIRERLFFDAESGLLLRRNTYKPTALGFLADQTDFEDYRIVDGVKAPFRIKNATGAFASTRTYTEVKFNVPLDDAKFSTAEDAQGRSGK